MSDEMLLWLGKWVVWCWGGEDLDSDGFVEEEESEQTGN
jgi:hypothetical protein